MATMKGMWRVLPNVFELAGDAVIEDEVASHPCKLGQSLNLTPSA